MGYQIYDPRYSYSGLDLDRIYSLVSSDVQRSVPEISVENPSFPCTCCRVSQTFLFVKQQKLDCFSHLLFYSSKPFLVPKTKTEEVEAGMFVLLERISRTAQLCQSYPILFSYLAFVLKACTLVSCLNIIHSNCLPAYILLVFE